MPIKFNLEKLREMTNSKNFFETGLWDPRTNNSSKIALKCNFKKLYCIEIREEWVNLGKEIFKEEISNDRYHLYLDDSSNMKKYLDQNKDNFKDKTIFFLDAHVDNANIKNYKYKCPLFDEIKAISTLERKDNVILIDDLRIIKNSFPWGEKQFGNIDWVSKIINMIKEINKDYKFELLDGVIEKDVLCAYI